MKFIESHLVKIFFIITIYIYMRILLHNKGTLFSIRFNFISRQKNQQHSYSHKPNLLN